MNIFLGLTAAAWLMPNHYAPWSSAWGDAAAIASLLAFSIFWISRKDSDSRISLPLLAISGLCTISVLVQLIVGKLMFIGDAVMVFFYIALWLLAALSGRWIAARWDIKKDTLNTLNFAWTFAAILSVGIALNQWTDALSLGIYGAELPPGGRPFGNVAQPNHLSTLCFLGVCGLLWTHQQKKVRTIAFWIGAVFLLFGIVMSQSRTGWIQVGLLVMAALSFKSRANLLINRGEILLLGIIFIFGVIAWPYLCDAVFLSAGRSINDQMQPGIRLPYWQSMLDAIGREPLLGYGWQQIGAAQQEIAADHPSVGILFEHSHNLVLDLFLWAGVPFGGLLIGATVWWFGRQIVICRDAKILWLLAAASGVFIHSMVEYPLEYAYFLIPTGLAMGAVDGFAPKGTDRSLYVPRWLSASISLILCVLSVAIGTEYLKAEINYRILRFESARVGYTSIVTPSPNLRVLTQLEALLKFARTEASPGMSPEQLNWMRQVAARFGYPPTLFRYALAAGLNNEPDTAHITLIRLCRLHEPRRCEEAKESWELLQDQYPQLKTVSFPAN